MSNDTFKDKVKAKEKYLKYWNFGIKFQTMYFLFINKNLKWLY
jgi:hypothetical protein